MERESQDDGRLPVGWFVVGTYWLIQIDGSVDRTSWVDTHVCGAECLEGWIVAKRKVVS